MVGKSIQGHEGCVIDVMCDGVLCSGVALQFLRYQGQHLIDQGHQLDAL